MAHPPAWYPDPRHPGRVRRWDGRAWTGDVRPMPDWLRTVRLSPGPRARLPHTTRALWATSAILLVLGGVLLIVLRITAADTAVRVGDHRFLRLAEERCAKTEDEVIGPNRRHLTGPAEAERVDMLATGWDAMVVDLRALPVAPGDEAKVDRWLGAWERSTALVHDYAGALAAKDTARGTEVLRRSARPKAEMNHFAYANGLNACVFD